MSAADRPGTRTAAPPSGYPAALYAALTREFDVDSGSVVADVESGTAILSRGVLESGAHVLAVEPNAAMRGGGERSRGQCAVRASTHARRRRESKRDPILRRVVQILCAHSENGFVAIEHDTVVW
jgi:hypothetical protein